MQDDDTQQIHLICGSTGAGKMTYAQLSDFPGPLQKRLVRTIR